MRASAPRSTALAAATADVVEAAQAMVAEQIAVARLEARADVARMLRAAAVGALGLVAASVALIAIVIAGTDVLEVWMPQTASLGLVGAITLTASVLLVRRARAELPSSHNEEPRALHAPAE